MNPEHSLSHHLVGEIPPLYFDPKFKANFEISRKDDIQRYLMKQYSNTLLIRLFIYCYIPQRICSENCKGAKSNKNIRPEKTLRQDKKYMSVDNLKQA